MTFERELNQKKKLQSQGKIAEDFTIGATALLSDDSTSAVSDGSYDHFIDITAGFEAEHQALAVHDDLASSPSPSEGIILFDELKNLHPDDLEEMDIIHQVALLSIRTNNFYKRTGRKFPGITGKSRVSFDKSKAQCF